ncbi:hypothetical protein [Candidatus Laterigemmans baculatus]|uniref:hypothetical protein n=1 Tax=Candidatus Laterigemmans baculatus TaxID=2770505 RepID=UPI0013DCD243|nr:hypothetical protein [Candidatus Laterigemmans baculatus]
MRHFCAALLAGLLLAAVPVGSARAEEADAKAPQTIRIFDALTLTVPEGWKPQPPKSRIVEHEFAAPQGEGEDVPTSRITMMAAGGDVEANISRWKGQFEGDSEAKVEKFQAAGASVHYVQLSGSFKDTMGGGPFSGGRTVVRENYGMLGAIIVLPNGRQYFIKLTGPQKAVDAEREAFKAMLQELKA